MSFEDLVEAAYIAAGHRTLTAAAAALGWSKGRLNNYLKLHRPVEVEHLAHIAETFHTTIAAIVPETGPIAELVKETREAAAALQAVTIESLMVRDADLSAVIAYALKMEGLPEEQREMLALLVPRIVRRLADVPEGVKGARRMHRAYQLAARSLGLPMPAASPR